MAQKRNPRERQIGKKPVEKKHFINPRYKNTFWTVVIIIILIIFFIINNTRETAASGPLPPGYNPNNLNERLHSEVPDQIKITDSTATNK